MTLDGLQSEYKRLILRQVNAYREICKEVRGSGTGSLFWGGLMLVLWYIAYFSTGRTNEPMAFVHLALGVSEIFVGFWKLTRPSPECILIDGIILFGFAAANGYRIYDAVVINGQKPWTGSIIFGIMMLLSGINHIKNYLAIRRSLVERPTREHVRFFDDLVKDVRAADPETDPLSMDVPTKPPVRGKLLGDTAIFVTKPGELLIAARENVFLHFEKTDKGNVEGNLIIEGIDFGWFPLDVDNLKNYRNWKGPESE